jgi:4-carboxymuconolactone decarboxylase
MYEQQQTWLQQQERLVVCLATPGLELEALELAPRQHAQVHASTVSQGGLFSFEDAVLDGLGDEQLRARPGDEPNSIAWLLWHCARIEDVTTNLLIAGQPQVIEREGWLSRLKISAEDVGTGMGELLVAQVTSQIDLDALRAYRQAVGGSTQQILLALAPERLHERVDPARIEQLLGLRVLGQGAEDLAEIWGSWKVGDLVRQPAIRHSFVHLQEAQEIRQKLTSSGEYPPYPRVTPVPLAEMSERTRELMSRAGLDSDGEPLAVFGTIARHPKLFGAWLPFASRLMAGGSLDRRQTELVILRVASNMGSDYEWGQHVELSAPFGVDQVTLTRILAGPTAAGWSPLDALLLLATDELHTTRRISGNTWDQLSTYLSEAQLIELCFLVGQYEMLAMFLQTVGVPLEPGKQPLPRGQQE